MARSRILDLDARLVGLDHYALLEIERAADKKTIKRAYFALAAVFHPDRYFGKKLGKARAPLERVFMRLTEAHDTLVSRPRRAAYDATLPPPRVTRRPPRATKPPPRTSKPPPRATKPPARPSSRTLEAQTQPPVAPPPVPPPVAIIVRAPEPPPRSPPAPAPAPPPPALASPAPSPPSSPSPDSLRRLYASTKQAETQRRVDIFLHAAEEAIKHDDLVTAANNFRLALQNTEDPAVRARLDAIDEKAKVRAYEIGVTRGRAAEKLQRWADAAGYFAKAHAVKAEAWTADRAANALRLAGGDLHRAARFAEDAVRGEPNNIDYRLTLGEVYLSAKLYARAAGEAARALALTPGDKRAKALVAAVAKARR